MQKAEDFYGNDTYPQMLSKWSAKYGSASYTWQELERIHQRWKALGKKVAQGPAVRLDSRKRR
jgi:hypothetical protein